MDFLGLPFLTDKHSKLWDFIPTQVCDFLNHVKSIGFSIGQCHSSSRDIMIIKNLNLILI